MWRALFLAIGISLCFLGAETLVVDKAILADTTDRRLVDDFYTSSDEYYEDDYYYEDTSPRRVIVPPEWAPWGLLSAGVVVILYAMTMRTAVD